MESEIIFLALFPIFFIGLWAGVLFLLALMGGWSSLAQHYQSQADFSGKKWYFQSGRLGWVNYNGCLTVGSNYRGVYLAVFPLFRPGHPALFIPWYDIRTTEHQGWLFAYRDFTFAKAPSVRLRVWRRLGDKLTAARTEMD
jgi:hypothetical protein